MPRKLLIQHKDIAVIGASAGGVEALKAIVSALTAEFGGTIFIVLHIPPDHASQLSVVLSGVCQVPVLAPLDSDEIKSGHVYVATADHHLLLENGKVRVTLGPKENTFRPSVDALFRSAALAYGARVVGVVVSGCLDDGSSGLFAIKSLHGTAIVQQPADALYDSMPVHALDAVDADFVLPAAEIGQMLQRLSDERVESRTGKMRDKQLEVEVNIAMGCAGLMKDIMALGKPTPYTCPECHGALLEISGEYAARFRCHTGHGFTLSHLLGAASQTNEEAIMGALRSIEEVQLLLERVHIDLTAKGKRRAARLLKSRIELVKGQAELVKKASLKNKVVSEDTFTTESDG